MLCARHWHLTSTNPSQMGTLVSFPDPVREDMANGVVVARQINRCREMNRVRGWACTLNRFEEDEKEKEKVKEKERHRKMALTPEKMRANKVFSPQFPPTYPSELLGLPPSHLVFEHAAFPLTSLRRVEA